MTRDSRERKLNMLRIDSELGRVALVPEWLLSNASGEAVRLYALLALSADAPSVTALAARAGCSATTIRRLLRELETATAVTIMPRRRDDGGHLTNLIVLRYVAQFDLAPPSISGRGGLSNLTGGSTHLRSSSKSTSTSTKKDQSTSTRESEAATNKRVQYPGTVVDIAPVEIRTMNLSMPANKTVIAKQPAVVSPKSVIAEFCVAYQAATGVRYHMTAKAAGQLKRLVETHGAVIRELIPRFFASTDPWILSTDRGVGVFVAKIAWLLTRATCRTTSARDQRIRALLDQDGGEP